MKLKTSCKLTKNLKHVMGKDFLWSHLHDNQFKNLHFKQNYALDPVVFDFYCQELRLLIDVLDPPVSNQAFEQKLRIVVAHDLYYFPILDEEDITQDIYRILAVIELHQVVNLV